MLRLSILVYSEHIYFCSRRMSLKFLWIFIIFHALSFGFHLIPDITFAAAFGLSLLIFSPCLSLVAFSYVFLRKHRPKLTKIVPVQGMFHRS